MNGWHLKKFSKYKQHLQEVLDYLTHNQLLGLESYGLVPVQEADGHTYKFLGVISKNRVEWGITDLACLSSSVTIVPFFDSLGPDALAFILNQT